MTDRTPTEATWKRVPTEPTTEMIEAFWRSPSVDAQAEPKQPNDEAEWYGTRAEFIAAVRAMLAASPPAPAAEPVARQWRYRGIRAGQITKWSEWTDGDDPELQPFGNLSVETETRPLYTHPIGAAAIRAEARKEALEEMLAAIHAHLPAIPVALGDALRALAAGGRDGE